MAAGGTGRPQGCASLALPLASQMAPKVMQSAVSFLPLTHAVAIIRPLVIGQPINDFWLHFSYLCVFGIVGMYIAVAMVRRRLII